MRIRLRTGAKTTTIAGSTGAGGSKEGVDDVVFWCLEKRILGDCQCREHPRRSVASSINRGGFRLINAQVGLIIAFFASLSCPQPSLAGGSDSKLAYPGAYTPDDHSQERDRHNHLPAVRPRLASCPLPSHSQQLRARHKSTLRLGDPLSSIFVCPQGN